MPETTRTAARVRARRRSLAVVVAAASFAAGGACVGNPGWAQEVAPARPADIPTIEGTRDATIPTGSMGRGSAATPVTTTSLPEAAGTLSSWRASPNRTAVRIAGEHSADELLGAVVVDGMGRELGRIEDLLIDTDGMARKAVVRPLGGGRPAFLDLTGLTRREDGDGGGFVATIGDNAAGSP